MFASRKQIKNDNLVLSD